MSKRRRKKLLPKRRLPFEWSTSWKKVCRLSWNWDSSRLKGSHGRTAELVRQTDLSAKKSQYQSELTQPVNLVILILDLTPVLVQNCQKLEWFQLTRKIILQHFGQHFTSTQITQTHNVPKSTSKVPCSGRSTGRGFAATTSKTRSSTWWARKAPEWSTQRWYFPPWSVTYKKICRKSKFKHNIKFEDSTAHVIESFLCLTSNNR